MKFIDNKYTNCYNRIISRARNRVLDDDIYTERHHIIPSSLDGSDDSENLVTLTAREHFICHWLLIKMTSGNSLVKMTHALNRMRSTNETMSRYETPITSRVYDKVKKLRSKFLSERMSGENNPMYGTSHSDERKIEIGKVTTKMLSDLISSGKHPWVGSSHNSHQLSIGNHPSQIHVSCITCRKVMSIGMFIRWCSKKCRGVKGEKNSQEWHCDNCGKSGKGMTNFSRWHSVDSKTSCHHKHK